MFKITRKFAPFSLHINSEEEKRDFLNILYAAHRQQSTVWMHKQTEMARQIEQLIKELE